MAHYGLGSSVYHSASSMHNASRQLAVNRPMSASVSAARHQYIGSAPAIASTASASLDSSIKIPEISPSDLSLVRVMGRGGQKRISLVRHLPSGALLIRCTLAEGVISASPAQMEKLRQEFRSEIEILCQLQQHRNVVKILGLVADSSSSEPAVAGPGVGGIGALIGFGGPAYGGGPVRANAAMQQRLPGLKDTPSVASSSTPCLSFLLEYCAHGSLRDALHASADSSNASENNTFAPPVLDDALKVQIAKASARTIHFLHSLPMPVIHADVKPANVLLTMNNQVRICDFGLSKTQLQTSGLIASQVGSVRGAGTVNYMAPEQFQLAESKLSYKIDVWSFGCLLIELFGSKHSIPYSGFNAAAIPFQITQGNSPPELEEVENSELRSMIQRLCLVADPSKRASMADVLTGLRSIFPDDEFPDEQDAEADEISQQELCRRQQALPPLKFFEQFVEIAAAEQGTSALKGKQAAAVQPSASLVHAQAAAVKMPRPQSATIAQAQQMRAQDDVTFGGDRLGKTSVAMKVEVCLASPGFEAMIQHQQKLEEQIQKAAMDRQHQIPEHLIEAAQRAYHPKGPTPYQAPPPLPPKQVLHAARAQALGQQAPRAIAPLASVSSVSTKSTSAVPSRISSSVSKKLSL